MNTNELKTGGPCPLCAGKGIVWQGGQGGDYETCPDCGGTGKVIDVDFHGVEPRQNPFANILTFSELERACLARQNELDPTGKLKALFFANEQAGEVGESVDAVLDAVIIMVAASGRMNNHVKKIERDRLSILPLSISDKQARQAVADELADVIITAQNIAGKFGINLGMSVRAKFNATSAKRGLSTTL